MKTTLSQVIDKSCFTIEEADLFRAVIRQMSATWQEVFECPMDYSNAAKGVGGFIDYTETEKFAKRHIENILSVLNEFEIEIGKPLKQDNNNLLHWYACFALKHTIQKIIDYKKAFFANS